MGHILAHAEISKHVIAQLTKVRPGEEYTYLELGNFLTDIDQFRDPYANFSAKSSILISAVRAKLPAPIIGLPIIAASILAWRDELLGKAEPNKRYGALASFFTHVARFATHQFFAEDSPIHLYSSTGLTGTMRGDNIRLLTPAEVNRVFDAVFTQYYPHEHLDFPPYREGPDHRDSKLYQRAKRGLIGYLEEQLQYVSEEFTKIELSWVLNRDRSASHESRRDILVRLGHLLHTVEDYFFHSNFIEIYQWNRLQRHYPYRRVANMEDYDFLLHHGLLGTRHDAKSILLRRRLGRRLRYPVFIR
ncbi:MAG: hypothetical protein L0220_20175, partial [Acidobacteria bacterium]|nr:hypothetical protein [Acidobacteriota bacterium]